MTGGEVIEEFIQAGGPFYRAERDRLDSGLLHLYRSGFYFPGFSFEQYGEFVGWRDVCVCVCHEKSVPGYRPDIFKMEISDLSLIPEYFDLFCVKIPEQDRRVYCNLI